MYQNKLQDFNIKKNVVLILNEFTKIRYKKLVNFWKTKTLKSFWGCFIINLKYHTHIQSTCSRFHNFRHLL